MATTYPRWPELCPPRTGRALTPVERREYHAVRLALVLAAGVIQNRGFMREYQPIPGEWDDHQDWLRATLAPLEASAPTVALVRRLMDWGASGNLWNDPRRLGANLRHLAAVAARLGHWTATSRAAGRSA